MDIGSYTIVPLIHPLEMTNFTYSSSDTKVATVSKDGVVTFKKAGKVTITVKTHNGHKKSVTINIKKAAKSVSLGETSLAICMHEKTKLKIRVSPENCYSEYTAFSYDESICTFSSDGVITPKSAGTTTVGIELYNGILGTCRVTVYPEIEKPEDIKNSSFEIPLGKKTDLQLSACLDDGTPVCNHFSYESMDNNIASVDINGKVLGKKLGTVDIKITASNGVVTYRPVHVLKVPQNIQIYEKNDPDARNLSSVKVYTGACFDLAAKAGLNEYCDVVWSSSNSKIVSVDSATGTIVALKKGSAKITAQVKATNTKKTITITVRNPGNISPSDLDLAFAKPSSKEQYILQKNSVQLASDIYNFVNARSTLKKLGFEGLRGKGDIHFANNICKKDGNTVGYAVASKTINVNGFEETLYVVVIRGSDNKHEWVSNFYTGPNGDALGFGLAAKDVAEYLNTLQIDARNSKIWFCGHSRGAVVANYLAGQWAPNAGFDPLDIYAYTFACPNITSNASGYCPGIFNYNFAADIVPMVPFEKEWGLTKFGKTNSADNEEFNQTLGIIDAESTAALRKILSKIDRRDYHLKIYPLVEEGFYSDDMLKTIAKIIITLEKDEQLKDRASELLVWLSDEIELRLTIDSLEKLLNSVWPEDAVEQGIELSQRAKDTTKKLGELISGIATTHLINTYCEAVESNYFRVK